jgi:UDP-N-acetylmuramoyl-L-alanyl-D-glutamate--2,6-diaminopimelate ligase
MDDQSMKLRELAGQDFPEIADLMAGPAGDLAVTGLTSDSRKVTPGMLFAALAGTKADGSSYIGDAAARGAAAAIAGHSAEAGIPVLAVSNPRRLLALAAAPFLPCAAGKPWSP